MKLRKYRIPVLLLTLICIAFIFACKTQDEMTQEEIDQLLAEGQQYWDAGNYQEAVNTWAQLPPEYRPSMQIPQDQDTDNTAPITPDTE